MKKTAIVVLGLAAFLLTAPLVGFASAGKGQEKLDFRMVMIGTYRTPINVLENENTIHFDLGFRIRNPLTSGPHAGLPPLVVEIDGETIPANRFVITDPLNTIGFLYINQNLENGAETVRVNETITVKAADGHVMGTLEFQCMGQTNMGNGVGEGNHFIGHGTGELKDAKIEGETVSVETIGQWTAPNGMVVNVHRVERVGTIMGW